MREFNVDIKKILQNGKHDNSLIFNPFYGGFQSGYQKKFVLPVDNFFNCVMMAIVEI
jgi:hypothetical protein